MDRVDVPCFGCGSVGPIDDATEQWVSVIGDWERFCPECSQEFDREDG